jgi:hypothetical protein
MNMAALNLRSKLFKKRPAPEGPKPGHEGGGIYVMWLTALPLIMGGAIGWLTSVCLGIFLDQFENTGLQRRSAPGVEQKREAKQEDGMTAFLTANPFRISPVPPPTEEEKPPVEEEKPKVIGSLATAVLKGTMPDVGAWIDDSGQLRLVLVGASFDVYTLDEVTYRDAVFVKGDDVVVLELLYGPVAEKRVVEVPTPPPPKPEPEAAPVGDVIAATDDHEGQISSELVNSLVQNPFDELKKVRIRPKDGEAGLQIQWIRNDSILKKLGVKKGDVIKSVNGIPFTNMADIANSITSLMSSERFDVEVDRKGKPASLRYVVR